MPFLEKIKKFTDFSFGIIFKPVQTVEVVSYKIKLFFVAVRSKTYGLFNLKYSFPLHVISVVGDFSDSLIHSLFDASVQFGWMFLYNWFIFCHHRKKHSNLILYCVIKGGCIIVVSYLVIDFLSEICFLQYLCCLQFRLE